MSVIPGIGGIPGRKKVIPIESSYITSFGAPSGTSSTNYTSPSINFGAEAPNRKILVGMYRQGGATVSRQRLAGVDMDVLFAPASNYVGWAWWICSMPTGASGTLNNIMSTNTARGFGVWRLIGAGDLFDSAVEVAAGANPSVQISLKKGGLILGGVRGNGNIGTSWTGLTSDLYTGPYGSSSTRGTAGRYHGDPQTDRTLSLTTSIDCRISAVSLQPE